MNMNLFYKEMYMKKIIFLFFLSTFVTNITAMDNEEEIKKELKTAWVKLQKLESKKSTFPSISPQQTYFFFSEESISIKERTDIRERIESLKNSLPTGCGEEIIKELEKHYDNEEELKRHWGHLQLLESRIKMFMGTPGVIEYVRERDQTRHSLESVKRNLPEGRGDEIIKKLEEQRDSSLKK